MPKKAKSQWEFGDLVREAESRKVFTVSQLTSQIRRVLQEQFGSIWVSGELSNLRVQTSGHIYFTLKDAAAQLSCVLFRGETGVDRQLLQDGRKVNLRGEITLYEPRGQYQLRVLEAELQGLGRLQEAFERLKQKLSAQGLFDPARKRPIPRFPGAIGVVTSPTGAALHDVLHVIERRYPGLRVLLAPCRVQGEGAAAEIASAIALLNEYNSLPSVAARPEAHLDLILVTRGGGSLEDLWAFNEELVARAIYNSELPVLSAVGHEIDFTISDFVADFRAATPSAAAEIITEGPYAACQFVAGASVRLRQLVRRRFEQQCSLLRHGLSRLNRAHPARRLNLSLQRLDDAQSRLARCARAAARGKRLGFVILVDRLTRLKPSLILRDRRRLLLQHLEKLRTAPATQLARIVGKLDSLRARLRLLGPQQVLARGYSITFDAQTGALCRNAGALKTGQILRTRLQMGEVHSRVEPAPE